MTSFNQDTGDFSQRILNLYLNNLVNKEDILTFSQRPSNLTTNFSVGEKILNNLVKNINNLYFLTKSLVNIPDYEFDEDEQKKIVENDIKNITKQSLMPKVTLIIQQKIEDLKQNPTKDMEDQIQNEILQKKIKTAKKQSIYRSERIDEIANQKVNNDRDFIDSLFTEAR
jgi:hypothetical protein